MLATVNQISVSFED